MTAPTPLDTLRIADPDTYTWVKGRIELLDTPPDNYVLARLAEETIWALAQEPGLGRAVADGMLRLMAHGDAQAIDFFVAQVKKDAATGPSVGRLMAVHLVPVLQAGGQMPARFLETVAIMRRKGTYTLNEPLAVLSELLTEGDRPCATAWLDLLAHTFSRPITYNHSVRLVYLLPKAVRGFTTKRRRAQIEQMVRVVRADIHLVDAYVAGMAKGLALLAPEQLVHFIDQALARFARMPKSGTAFLGLASTLGAETAAGLQTAVPLTQIKGRLDSYLNARLGRPVGIKPLSDLPGAQTESSAWVVSDSRFIYLPDEVDRFSTRIENRTLAKVLVRLEAGFFESGSFDFDLERAADHYPEVAERTVGIGAASDPEGLGDAERFFTTFDRPRLARTLFDLFEQARVLRRMTDAYPGLAAHLGPALRQQARDLITGGAWTAPLALLYARLLPGFMPDHAMFREPPGWAATLAQRFDLALTARSGVEVCALLVCLAYETPAGQTAAPFPLPFHRRLRWDLVRRAQARTFRLVERIKTQLARQRIKVYRSDLRQRLAEQHGRITTDDIQSLVVSNGPATDAGRMAIDESALDLAALLRATGVDPAQAGPAEAKAVYYPEWDHQLQEYLPNHTRVRERLVAGDSDSGFYRQTLDDYRGMVARIRRAFEFLKPQGLAILRQWPEGDAFDYRALLDFAIDLKAGRTPSDRLFVKRLKQTRDVAALLLVDLSRSTANTVVGGRSTVLQTAKAALVLFCEALQVVGDTFAIAGFSGTGRLDVDYFRIKDFDSPLDNAVHGRISALQPQRSTRMGAAIRHATAQLAQMPARVRLLIVVSDGFPNDTGYKADHAIADTRHAAQEARARGVHLKAITVNIGSDPGLDDLYGRVHHHVISDVRELPDKLVRLYGTLTRRI